MINIHFTCEDSNEDGSIAFLDMLSLQMKMVDLTPLSTEKKPIQTSISTGIATML